MDEKTIKKLLGLRIKQLRKSIKLTQFQLGEKIGVDQRQVAYIEGGNSFPSLKTLNKFSNVFDCSIKDLFDYDHLDNPNNMKSKLVNQIANMNDERVGIYYQLFTLIRNYKG